MDNNLPSAKDVLATHTDVEEWYDLKYRGVRVAAPEIKIKRLLRDASDHDDVYMRAAYLLRKLVTNHYFEDANKRTAWLTTRDYLDQYTITPAERDSERVVKVMKAIRAYDVDELAEWLESGEIDEDRFNP